MVTALPDNEMFDLWLADQPRVLTKLLVGVRSAILDAQPDFTEAKKWGVPNYWLPDISRRTICMINVHKDEYVRIEYHNGATLPDPESRLEGSGKSLRHIKVRPDDVDDLGVVTRYAEAAVELARSNPKSLAG